MKSIEIIDKEIAKCELVCRQCHLKRTIRRMRESTMKKIYAKLKN